MDLKQPETDIPEAISLVAFIVGGVLFLAAWFISLLRRTRGMPTRPRSRLIAYLACRAIYNALPSRRTIFILITGLFAFLTSFFFGIVLTWLIIYFTMRDDNYHVTEAYEGFGDAMMGLFYLAFGAMISLLVSIIVGALAAEWAAKKYRKVASSNSMAVSQDVLP